MKTKLSRRGKAIIEAKKLLEIIREKPGLTKAQLDKRAEMVGQSLAILQRHRLIRFEQPLNAQGLRPQRWYAVEMGGKAVAR